MVRSTKPSVADVTIDPKYKKYDSFVGVCIAQLLFGLIGVTIGGYMLQTECLGDFGRMEAGCERIHRTDSIAAIVINTLVSIISLMGIVVAASELPLLRKQSTLLDVMKMDQLYERAKRLQTAHVWISLLMSVANYVVLFVYLYSILHSVMHKTIVPSEDKFFMIYMILLVFYLLEFALFMVTAVAQKAIIVTTFNKTVRAITEETARDKDGVIAEVQDDLIKTNGV